jgi:hypothetical protein
MQTLYVKIKIHTQYKMTQKAQTGPAERAAYVTPGTNTLFTGILK